MIRIQVTFPGVVFTEVQPPEHWIPKRDYWSDLYEDVPEAFPVPKAPDYKVTYNKSVYQRHYRHR